MRVVMLASILCLTLASAARAEVINLQTDATPRPGHVEILSYGSYAPYSLRILDGTVYAANPVGSGYHWGEVWTSLEVGVLPGTSLTFVAPYDLSQRFDATSPIQGLGDCSLGLARRLYQDPDGSLKLRFHLDLPTGDLSRGLGTGVPAVGLEGAFRRVLWRDRLEATWNLNYLYQLRSTLDDPTTHLPRSTWRGHRLQVGASFSYLEWHPWELVGEILAQWDSSQEADRLAVARTGDAWILLAPGACYHYGSHLDLQVSGLFPAWRGGYQDSYPYTVVGGARLRL